MISVGHVVVVGGGIAGVSAAYFLAVSGQCDRVTLLEAEQQLAHHTTGRSAALFTENYGEGPVRPLSHASLDFLENPPAGLADHPVLTKRGIMTIATAAADHDELERQLQSGTKTRYPVVEIPADQAVQAARHIRFGPDHRVIWEEHASDIDVAGLHQAFVRGLRQAGGEVETSRRVDAARPQGDGWTVETTKGELSADVLVNAAGAWADVVAVGAGVSPIGMQPKKRTAFMVKSPFEDSADWPFVADVHHAWYLRPDGDQFMCSPADEQPSEPCDAKADEIDIARTIEVVNEHTRLNIRAVQSHWAGLRTFSPDRSMVIGAEPGQPNFIWCAGQGGTGIQTSPGAGRLVADLVTNGRPSDHFDNIGLRLDALLPDRFRAAE